MDFIKQSERRRRVMDFLVRKVNLDEIETVFAVTAEAYLHPYDSEDKVISAVNENSKLTESVESGDINIFVAVIDDKIIGAVRYVTKDDITHLSKLVVLKDYRNKGIAKELVRMVELEAKKLNSTKVTLDFMQEKNLRPYYEKLGYTVTEIREHGNHHDVFAEKNLIKT
ncbi:MAG: GNAT family N-acetyltransferase [Patescibacteria group bacterium]|nr:GNAT family N-acetyltransferase [Patescibacteria group bacterium]